MRIKVVVPIISDIFNESIMREFTGYAKGRNIDFDVENLTYGPASIECAYDEALAVPDILNIVERAAKEGFDGAIIDCFGDPGVKAAREIVNIPVMGGFEPSMLLAAGLGQALGIVTVLPSVLPMIHSLSTDMGLASRLAAVRYVNIPVLDLGDMDKLENALFEQSLAAVRDDGVHVIVLGCTGMMGLAANLHNRLLAAGYDAPVIDPAFAALTMVETYVNMGLKHSRQTYMTPPDKERRWWS